MRLSAAVAIPVEGSSLPEFCEVKTTPFSSFEMIRFASLDYAQVRWYWEICVRSSIWHEYLVFLDYSAELLHALMTGEGI